MDTSRFQKAIQLRNSNRLEDAIMEFRAMATEVTGANEQASLLLNEARCYASLGRPHDAERVFQQINSLPVDDPVVRANVEFGSACVAEQAGRPVDAIQRYETVLKEYAELLQQPEYLDFLEEVEHRKAICLANVGRCVEAIPALRSARAFATLSSEEQREVHLALGMCYEKVGDPLLAREALTKVIDQACADEIEAQARYRISLILFKNGALAQAKQELEPILSWEQNDFPSVPQAFVYEQLSNIATRLGNEEDATRYKRLANSGHK